MNKKTKAKAVELPVVKRADPSSEGIFTTAQAERMGIPSRRTA